MNVQVYVSQLLLMVIISSFLTTWLIYLFILIIITYVYSRVLNKVMFIYDTLGRCWYKKSHSSNLNIILMANILTKILKILNIYFLPLNTYIMQIGRIKILIS